MLRINVSVNGAGAVEYFDRSLSTEDYYSKGEVQGRWGGRAALALGLEGEVTREQFSALVHNKHPQTGEQLTLRQSGNRRAGYDFTFNAPKSLSVAYVLTGNKELLEAWQQSVRETMQEIEQEVRTRVRKKGQLTDRVTGNAAWAEFTHLTARPEAGRPDPHLHTHAYLVNCTRDPVEHAWKAIEIGEIKRDAPYWEALAHSKVADRLARSGYAIERTQNGWELRAVPARLREVFSSRTRAIEKLAREKGITDPESKSQLGARTRQKKVETKPAELRAEWQSRLLPQEKEALARIKPDAQRARQAARPCERERHEAAQKAVDVGLSHGLERQSVVGVRQLLLQALKHGVGKTGLAEIRQALDGRADVIARDFKGRRLLTTSEVLREEQRMVSFARQTRGTCAPYVDAEKLRARPEEVFSDPELSAEQKAAVEHVLTSKDQVMMLSGKAGAGKTRTLRVVADAVQKAGHRVVAVAPSAEASRKNLRDCGFAGAETVAHLLQNEQAQQRVKPRDLILVDEAGQLGCKDVGELFALARRSRARVLLVGDVRQHGPVPRGEALKILEHQSGIVPAQIKAIRRQQGIYREAVEALARGDTRTGFGKLEELKAIREIPNESQRYAEAAKDYVELSRKGQEVLVVSPTHHEAEKQTEQIRLRLRNEKLLGPSAQVYTRLESLGMTVAMRADPINYRAGDVIQFRQRVPGFSIGHRTPVLGNDEQGRVLVRDSKGQIAPLPLERARDFEAYQPSPISLAPGDKVRFTQNGKTKDNHRINNGSVQRVAGFLDNGDVRLENGWVVDKNFGHFKHGYVTTSYSAQSRTVDAVLIVQGRESEPAASQAQAYVSVSRGRSAVRIYTDDRQALESAVRRSDTRVSATELAGAQPHQQRRSRLRKRAEREQPRQQSQERDRRSEQQRPARGAER